MLNVKYKTHTHTDTSKHIHTYTQTYTHTAEDDELNIVYDTTPLTPVATELKKEGLTM
jgi:hypothetical protein